MDLITQGILGAAIAEAGWRHKLGRGAIVAGVLFGLAPDLDVLSNLWGSWSSIVHHRGFTHSIFFAPLVAPIAGYIAWRLSDRRGHATSWMHCIFWALLTHPLLDVFTTYGTQLLAPLSNRRFALDGISIIDPLYTFPLMLALLAAFIWRKYPRRGQLITALALVATTSYLGLGYATSLGVREVAERQLSGELTLGRIKAAPTLANLVLWRVMVEDSRGDTHIGLYSATKKQPIKFVTRAHLDSPLIERALLDERAQIFTWFSQEWLGYRVDESGANTVLYMDDLRNGSVRDVLAPLWGAKVTFAPDGTTVMNVERVNYNADRPDLISKEIRAIFIGVTRGPDHIPSSDAHQGLVNMSEGVK